MQLFDTNSLRGEIGESLANCCHNHLHPARPNVPVVCFPVPYFA